MTVRYGYQKKIEQYRISGQIIQKPTGDEAMLDPGK
jgi:hypothetical protein